MKSLIVFAAIVGIATAAPHPNVFSDVMGAIGSATTSVVQTVGGVISDVADTVSNLFAGPTPLPGDDYGVIGGLLNDVGNLIDERKWNELFSLKFDCLLIVI